VQGAHLTDIAAFFHWESVKGASSKYEIQFCRDNGFANPLTFEAPVLSANVSVWFPEKILQPGKWYWRVRAVNKDSGPGRWSETRWLVLNNEHSTAPLVRSISPQNPLFMIYAPAEVEKAWKALPAELKPQVNGRYAMIVPPETPQFAQYPVQVEITDTKASNSRTETLTVFPKIRITGEIIGPSSVIGGTWLELTAATQHQGGNDPSFHYAWTLPSGWSQPIGNGTPTLRVLSPPVAVSTPGTFSVVVTPSVALPGTENNPYPDKRSIKADAVGLPARSKKPVTRSAS
jgi:hypothetical protein